LNQQLQDLESELSQELLDIDAKWATISQNVTTQAIPLERTDVQVTQLNLVWIPVP